MWKDNPYNTVTKVSQDFLMHKEMIRLFTTISLYETGQGGIKF